MSNIILTAVEIENVYNSDQSGSKLHAGRTLAEKGVKKSKECNTVNICDYAQLYNTICYFRW